MGAFKIGPIVLSLHLCLFSFNSNSPTRACVRAHARTFVCVCACVPARVRKRAVCVRAQLRRVLWRRRASLRLSSSELFSLLGGAADAAADAFETLASAGGGRVPGS
eukprot:4670624-Pleurochrysis_carterae.AAC.1